MESCSIDTKRFTKGLWKNKLGEEVERERRKEKVRDRDRKREREREWCETRTCERSMTYPGFFKLIEGLPLLLTTQALFLLVQREIRARL